MTDVLLYRHHEISSQEKKATQMCKISEGLVSPVAPLDNLCCVSVAQLCPTLLTPWTAAPLASPSFTISQSQLKLLSIESVKPSNHLILCCPLSYCLQSFPATGSFLMSRLFTSGSHKYWSFSISASNDCSGLISFRTDWFDLLAAQGTVKSFSSTIV